MPRERSGQLRIEVVLVTCCVLVLSTACMTWAGPILRVTNVDSVARSTKECGGHVLKVMKGLEKDRLLASVRSDGFGSTKDSSVYAECVLVGKNQHKQDRWIIHISIASNDEAGSTKLRKELEDRFKRITRID